MPMRTIDPRSIHTDVWNVARAWRVEHSPSLADRFQARWPADDIKALDEVIARLYPERDPEDIYSALRHLVRGGAIINGYSTHISFMEDAEVYLQSTVDGERVYTVDFGAAPDLPNFYIIIPLAYAGFKPDGQGDMSLIMGLESDLENLPSRPKIQWVEELLPAQPGADIRDEMFKLNGSLYNAWMLPTAMSEDELKIVRKRLKLLHLAKEITDGTLMPLPDYNSRNN